LRVDVGLNQKRLSEIATSYFGDKGVGVVFGFLDILGIHGVS
jgi:hypothetical protein